MNYRRYKILASVALLVEIIIIFILFARIKNIVSTFEIINGQNTTYVLLIVAAIIPAFLFSLAIILTYKNEKEDLYAENQIKVLEDESDKENLRKEKEDKKQEQKIDTEAFVNKILPKEEGKLNLEKYSEKLLSNIAKELDIVQGLLFHRMKDSEEFTIAGKYAYFGETEPKNFKLGETLSGQVAKNQTLLNLSEIPENYITILSGLGTSSPNHLIIIPVIFNKETIAVIELASFKEFKKEIADMFSEISQHIGKSLSKY
ncbi:MAG: GAF domain-containing protein [Bacteroidales bacterium]